MAKFKYQVDKRTKNNQPWRYLPFFPALPR